MTFWDFVALHPFMTCFCVFVIACALSDIVGECILKDRRRP